MELPKLPMFSDAALATLDQMPCFSTERGRFEWLSGGLIWPDEFPWIGTPERELMSNPPEAIGCLLACRAAITLAKETPFLPIWEQVARIAPNWPGLRPERRGEKALRRLRAALRLQDRCFAAIEANSDIK